MSCPSCTPSLEQLLVACRPKVTSEYRGGWEIPRAQNWGWGGGRGEPSAHTVPHRPWVFSASCLLELSDSALGSLWQHCVGTCSEAPALGQSEGLRCLGTAGPSRPVLCPSGRKTYSSGEDTGMSPLTV